MHINKQDYVYFERLLCLVSKAKKQTSVKVQIIYDIKHTVRTALFFNMSAEIHYINHMWWRMASVCMAQ